MQIVEYKGLGTIDYKECWDYQETLFKEVVDLKLANRDLPEAAHHPPKHYLIFCEHPHVYTLGKSGSEDNLLANQAKLEAEDATFYKINRGGDITYHGPGQLVGYPIFDLDHFFTDIHKYLRFLEESIIMTLAEYGIKAGRVDGWTGVWLDVDDMQKARKICAIGVKCSRWVTMHGFAVNVNSDLNYFKNIIPCGIQDKAVTSLSNELGHEVDMEEFKAKLKLNLSTVFDVDLVETETA